MHRFRLTPPPPFDLDAVVRSHGWVELAPWTWDDGVLARRERLGTASGMLAIRQAAPDCVVATWRPDRVGRARDPGLRAAVHAAVSRALSWDWDTGEFLALALSLDPRCHALAARGAGRLQRGTTFYEDFAKTMCTVNTTWAGTVAMCERLVETVGGGSFPAPDAVLAFGEARLKATCRLGFRARALIRATQRLREDGAIDADGHGRTENLGYDYLLSLFGIGPYAAAHCRVLLHDFSRLPIDSVVTAHVRDVLKLRSDKAVERHFARWGAYRFLAYRLRRMADRLAAEAAAATPTPTKVPLPW